jgi:hypothetical protein
MCGPNQTDRDILKFAKQRNGSALVQQNELVDSCSPKLQITFGRKVERRILFTLLRRVKKNKPFRAKALPKSNRLKSTIHHNPTWQWRNK